MISLLRSSFKIAINSLWAAKVRSLLAILGIVIGVASVIILVSVGSGLQSMVAGQFASIGANLLLVAPGRISGSNISSFASFTNQGKFRLEDLHLLSSIRGVTAVTADLDEFVPVRFAGETTSALVGGANEEFLEVFSWGVSRGRFFTPAEFASERKVVVIGEKIRKELFKDDPVGKDLTILEKHYKVVGVLSAKGGFGQFDWDSAVYMPLSSAQRFFGRDRLDSLYLKIEDTGLAKSITAQAEKILLKRYDEDDFSVLEQGDLFRAANSILSAVTLALGGIAAISLLVGGIGIMNIMLVSVAERTREIGLRKAVGGSFRDLLWQFLTEAVMIAALGGVLGIGLGVLGSLVLGRFLSTSITPWSVVLAFSFSTLVGIIFGILPAYKAAKLDPIEALRYE